LGAGQPFHTPVDSIRQDGKTFLESKVRIKRSVYTTIFIVTRVTRRLLGLSPIIIFYIDNIQHYLLVKPIVSKADNFYIFSPDKKITQMIDPKKRKHKVLFCDAIVFTSSYSRQDLNNYYFFLGIKSLSWFQLFHGITDGIDGYTYKKVLRSYQLIFCSSKHRYEQFIKLGFPRKKLKLVGYPKFDEIGSLDNARKPGKIRVLIAPTWGVRSCISFFSGDILEKIGKTYDVSISIHRHNNLHNWRDALEKIEKINVVDDLDFVKKLQQADLVISDVSSAGFEFLKFNKPIIFVDTPWNEFLKKDFENRNNIEHHYRDRIAFTISALDLNRSLISLIKKAIRLSSIHELERKKMHKRLMYQDGKKSPSELIIDSIADYFV